MIEGINSAVNDVRARVQRIREGRAVFLGAKSAMIAVSGRVWGRGQLTSGAELRYDEDYDLYAYTPPAPRKVTGRGKPYALWKNPPKTKAGAVKSGAAKIKGGYYTSYQAGFKKQQGRADTPFELTGRLRKAYFGGTDDPTPTEDSDTSASIRLRGEEAGKFRGLTDTKGPFLRLNDEEQAIFHKRVREIYVGE